MTGRSTLTVAAAVIGLHIAASLSAQNTEGSEYTASPLFAEDSVLHLTLTMDQRIVRRDIDSIEQREHPARLTYLGPDGTPVELDIQVRTRGHFRRQRRNCNFPPLRLNIKTGAAKGTLFENQDKLKLVTHCQNGRDEYERYVALEHSVYQVLNQLTDISFRARLVTMTYVDTESREETLTRIGIILESDEELAERLGGTYLDIPGAHPDDLDPEYWTIIELFQYMMGNTDWAIGTLHNIVVLDRDFRYYGVPYDFDWTGMVNARYARPDPSLDIRRVRDRLFRGFCRPREAYDRARQLMTSKKDSIYHVYRANDNLDDQQRDNAVKYLDEFFDVIEDDRRFDRRIMGRCRQL